MKNEVKKLNELEQESNITVLAKYNESKIAPPIMEQINMWVHAVR